MAKIFLAMALACVHIAYRAEDNTTTSTAASTVLDKFKETGRQAGQKIAQLYESTKPRKVDRGTHPEIIVTRREIHINGKPIALGQPMSEWKKVLPGTPQCEFDPGVTKNTKCKWNDLGIYLLEYRSTVYEFNMYFYLSPWHDSESVRADGSIRPPKPDRRPKHPYTGYFELDGYGIDAKTTLAEIIRNIDPDRGLRCGRMDDCQIERARHFTDRGRLMFITSRSDSKGQLEEFSIYAGQADFQPPTPPEECTPDSIEARMDHCIPPKPSIPPSHPLNRNAEIAMKTRP
jgi:hypothetical protein